MAHIERWKRFGVGAAVIVAVIQPTASFGQAARGRTAAPKVETEIEEITVTAQKREENIQEIPLSITAVTGGALEERRVRSVVDLTEAVPNLHVHTAGNDSSLAFSMRGTSQTNPNLEMNSTVGMYIDGVYIAKQTGGNFDIEDLERVEVLRGPQGTLYGRNTTGGAVNMITRKPTDEKSATLVTEVGNYDAFKGRVTLNMPLVGKNGLFQSDALGTIDLRENASYRSHDGFVRNEAPPEAPLPRASGGAVQSDMNRIANLTALRWRPRNDITVDYSFEYHRWLDYPYASQLNYVYPNSMASGAFQALGGPPDVSAYIRKNRVLTSPAHAALDNNLVTHRQQAAGNNRMNILTGAWDLGNLGPLGNVTVKSISAYRSMSADISFGNLDGTPLHLFDAQLHQNLEHWSEELQWVGTAPRLQYVLGAYYYGEHSTQVSQQIIGGGHMKLPAKLPSGATILAPFGNSWFVNHNKNDAWAPFGQATWTPPILNDKLSLTGGIRYSQEHVHEGRQYEDFASGPSTLFIASTGRGYGGPKAITFTGDASYQWKDELMTYFRASRGYVAGVINGTATEKATFNAIDPEILMMYEVGFKSQLLDNHLRINADLFYGDYSDQQVSVFIAGARGAVSALQNAGKAQYWGSELEAVAVPFRGVEATATYSYLNARYIEFLSQKTGPTGNPLFDANGHPILQNLAHTRPILLAPENTATVGLTYTAPPTSSGTFSAHVDAFWQDKMNLFVTDTLSSWNYVLVNGRLQLADIPLPKGSLDVAVFGRNLFDRKYRITGIDYGSFLGFMTETYGDPRTFGLGLTVHFTAG